MRTSCAAFFQRVMVSERRHGNGVSHEGKSASMKKRASALRHFLQMCRNGPVPFERFMQEALYHPEYGYYTATIKEIGARGDFTTIPARMDLLARAIASWIRKEQTSFRHIIEVGAGNGDLARGILRHLGWLGFLRWHYHIVDVSAPLRARQQKMLRGKRVRWHDSMQEALDVCRGEALIISNELVDAFPCTVHRRNAEGWEDLAVARGAEEWMEVWLPHRPLPVPSQALEQAFTAGQRVEVFSSFAEWLKSWVPAWKRGTMLLIDYGGGTETIYHRRPRGTLRAYFQQQRLEGPEVLQRPGLQDITADVNFEDLACWGRLAGLKPGGMKTLLHFAKEHGISVAKEVIPALESFSVMELRQSGQVHG